jgi:hypothetical protein
MTLSKGGGQAHKRYHELAVTGINSQHTAQPSVFQHARPANYGNGVRDGHTSVTLSKGEGQAHKHYRECAATGINSSKGRGVTPNIQPNRHG